MSSDTTPLPLKGALVGGAATVPAASADAARAGRVRARPGGRVGSATRRDAALAVLSLAVILGCSALIVVLAADRPSFLSSPTHPHFYPHWLAGPLGGLWPGLVRSGNTLRYVFTFAMFAMYASYLLGLRYVPRMRARWAIGAIVVVHAIFFLSPPLSLTDIFNYVNYGRMEVVHHLNPYTTIPVLEPHSDPSFDLSNWHQLLSPYGPLFTLLTFAVVPLGVAGSFWALKGVLMLASLATILLVWKCARLLERDPVQAIVFVGLNPVVLVWGLGGDHNDFVMVLFIVLGFYLLLRAGAERGRGAAALAVGAGAAFVTAMAVKASGGVLIPVVLLGLARTPRRLLQVALGMGLAAVAVALVSFLAFGLHLPDLSTQGRLVTNVSVPNLLGLALGQGGLTDTLRTLLSGVLVLSLLGCGVLADRRRELLTAAGWASVALLLTLGWVLPWYVLWVLPLAALSRSRGLRVAALTLGVYLVLAWVPLTSKVFNAVGFHPEKTPLGQLHQRYVRELLY
ncbi:MAG TPA: hypothetical protein VLJ42_07440 [Solirubrobacteraceae bacterium]|nr:hypothetical protein [Solirubrobacteraceae bacterium]